MALFYGIDLVRIIWLELVSEHVNLLFTILLNVHQLSSEFFFFFFQSQNFILTLWRYPFESVCDFVDFILFFFNGIPQFSQFLLINFLSGLGLSLDSLDFELDLGLEFLDLGVLDSLNFVKFSFKMVNFLKKFFLFVFEFI